MNGRLAIAVAASLIVVLSAPFVGQLREGIQRAFPEHYRLIIFGVVALAFVAAARWAARSIRERRLRRYGLVAAALVIATAYALATATGNPNVDAVERFHFVEYGLLAVLFHRAWAERGGAAAIVVAFMATFIVGTLDELMQWFVPLRVGEWRDVALNAVAIACGLLFGAAVGRVESRSESSAAQTLAPGLRSPDLRSADPAVLAAITLAVTLFAAFVYVVHVGHEIHDPEIGTFRSRFTADELMAASADRAFRWRTDPPIAVARLSREDQYLAEGIWHVQRRNEADRDGGVWAQWKENLILEKYFAPVLDTPTYLTPQGARWPRQQRDNAAAAAADARPFVSDAPPIPIYVLN